MLFLPLDWTNLSLVSPSPLRELGAQKVDLELEAEKMLVFQIQRSKFNLWLLHLKKWGWRIDLVFKNIFCSCRESGFNSRHPHGGPPHTSGILVTGDMIPSAGLHRH